MFSLPLSSNEIDHTLFQFRSALRVQDQVAFGELLLAVEANRLAINQATDATPIEGALLAMLVDQYKKIMVLAQKVQGLQDMIE